MDETPELPAPPTELEAITAEPPPLPVETPPPLVTTQNLIRDAALDLGAALATGFSIILFGVLAGTLTLIVTGVEARHIADLLTSPWGIAGMLLATQLPLLYFALRRRRRNREKKRLMPELFAASGLSAIPIGVAAGFGLALVSALYSGTLQRLLGEDSVQNQVDFLQNILSNKPAVALLVFIIAGVAPVCEEIFFRGVIFGSARGAGLSKAGVAISAVLFAIVHLIPLLAPFYATFAVVMCWLYTRTGTLAAPIAAHMTMNGLACAALLFAGDRV